MGICISLHKDFLGNDLGDETYQINTWNELATADFRSVDSKQRNVSLPLTQPLNTHSGDAARPTRGCPGPLRRDLNFQNILKAFLCYRTTVSGLTMLKASRQLLQKRESKIQKKRSRQRSWGRLIDRFKAATCCQSARFSSARSDVFSESKYMIKSNLKNFFIMDEEVSDLCEKVNNLSMDGIFSSKKPFNPDYLNIK